MSIRADLTVTDYWGIPQWPFLEGTIKNLIERKSQHKINEKIPGYERLIEDKINNAKDSGPATLDASSALEVVSYEALRDDPSLYGLLIENFILSGGKAFQLLAFDELNPEYIASVLNNQSYQSTVAQIDLDSGLWLKDFQLTLKTQDEDGNGSISPGDVRVFTAPVIRVELDAAVSYFSFTSKTNLLVGGRLDGSGHFSLTIAHTYEQPKIEFGNLQIEHLESPQLNPGLTRFLRDKLNQHLPDHIRDDDALLRDIATLLNDKIRDVIEGDLARRFLSRDEFLTQISTLARYLD